MSTSHFTAKQDHIEYCFDLDLREGADIIRYDLVRKQVIVHGGKQTRHSKGG